MSSLKVITNVKEILKEFNQSGVKYCVLRNQQVLFDNKGHLGSLDISVAKKDYPQMELILKQKGSIKRPKAFALHHQGYEKYFHSEREIVGFDTQINSVSWNDIVYLDEEIFKRRINKDGINLLSPEDELVMLITHSIVGKRYFKEEYQEVILRLLDQEDLEIDFVKKKLHSSFGKKSSEMIIQSLKAGNFKSIINKKNSFLIKYISKNPFIFLRTFLRWLIWKMPRKKPVIAFIGPDGAGKSTATIKLMNEMTELGKKNSLVYFGRGRNNIIPFTNIGRKYKQREKKTELIHDNNQQKNKEENKNQDSNQQKKNNIKKKVIYTLSAPVFTLDLLLRYLFFIFPKRYRKIMITDRYCSDIMLMENVPEWFRKFLLSFFPKPNLLFFVYNHPETLHQRRPKHSLQDFERQLKYLEKVSQKFNGIKVKSVVKDETYQEIAERTFGYLLKKGF
jgi:thymidylate kinase